VEPVFGQIKRIRGFRKFSLRGLRFVSAEWQLVCLTHNLLKIWRRLRWPWTRISPISTSLKSAFTIRGGAICSI
jgi:hypothetical protein